MTTQTPKPKTATPHAKPRAARPAASPAPKPAAKKKSAGARPAPASTPSRKPAAAPRKAPAKAKAARKARPTLVEVAVKALEDMKAHNIKVIDVSRQTDVVDTMIIATGTSDRHVKSLAGRVVDRVEEAGYRALGIEGEQEGEWVLVDLQDVLVHVMQPRIREFYGLEKLWDVRPGMLREGAGA